MALINCPDCEAEVSDQAEACPKCARPLARTKSVRPGRIIGFVLGFGLIGLNLVGKVAVFHPLDLGIIGALLCLAALVSK
jgi:hypothetical protein